MYILLCTSSDLGWPDGFGLFGLGLAGQMAQAGGDPRAHESPGR